MEQECSTSLSKRESLSAENRDLELRVRSTESEVPSSTLSMSPEPTRVKLVVRRLPPRLRAEEYFSCATGVERAVWKSYTQGKLSKYSTRTSTAHIVFANEMDAAEFFQLHNGARLEDAKTGKEYITRVERALFQFAPTTGSVDDPLSGTIEGDENYKRFLRKLELEPEIKSSSQSPPVQLRRSTKGPKLVVTTRLMEDVRSRRKEIDRKREWPGIRKLPEMTTASTFNDRPTLPNMKKNFGRPITLQRRAAAKTTPKGNERRKEEDGVYVVRISEKIRASRSNVKPVSDSIAPNALRVADSPEERDKSAQRATRASNRSENRGSCTRTVVDGDGPSSRSDGSANRIRVLKRKTSSGTGPTRKDST